MANKYITLEGLEAFLAKVKTLINSGGSSSASGEWEKVVDYTHTGDLLQFASYDSETGYYTAESVPDWVPTTDGESFEAVLNILNFSDAKVCPTPNGNNSFTCKLTLVSATDKTFTIDSSAPSGAPNVEYFAFSEYGVVQVKIPQTTDTTERYKVVIEDCAAVWSRYGGLILNGSSGYETVRQRLQKAV